MIQMGNDEFILYIRKKNDKCSLTNDQLGKMIWIWLMNKKHKGQKVNDKPEPAIWGDTAKNVSENGLPKSATQFKFNRNLLPELYNYLDELAVM